MLKKTKDCWYATKKFDSGFFGCFKIYEFQDNWFNVCLSIGKKRKNVYAFYDGEKGSNKLTTNVGTGLEPLIWAKKCILEFIRDFPERYVLDKPVYILVTGEDNRRYKAYRWGLKKIGFIEGHYFGQKGLVYKIGVRND